MPSETRTIEQRLESVLEYMTHEQLVRHCAGLSTQLDRQKDKMKCLQGVIDEAYAELWNKKPIETEMDVIRRVVCILFPVTTCPTPQGTGPAVDAETLMKEFGHGSCF